MSKPFDPDAPAVSDGLFGLPHSVAEALVVVVPVPVEATTSYRRGTAGGPAAMLAASRQVDLYDEETRFPWRSGIAMQEIDARIIAADLAAREPADRVIAAGGVGDDPALLADAALVNARGVEVNAIVEEKIAALLRKGVIPAVLGGDHSAPFGAHAAAAARYPGLGILHVDAHADLRDAYEGFTWSHASIFHNVMTRIPGVARLVQVGVRDVGEREMAMSRADERIDTWLDHEVAWLLADGQSWREIAQRIVQPLPEHVWVSFDIDGLDPASCPHTGTPVPGGLSWREATVLLKVLAESGRQIVGFDVCEVAPSPDGDEWDANVGARLLYKLAGHAVATRR